MGAVFSVMIMALNFANGFPGNLVCIVKIIVLGLVHFLLKYIPGLATLIAVWLAVYEYLFTLMLKLAAFSYYGVTGGALMVVDVGVTKMMGSNASVGASMRRLILMASACQNDARSWYRVAQWQRGNRYKRIMGGAGLCGCPCADAYAPSFGGLMCQRLPSEAPRRCPAAAVTWAFENGGKGALAVGQAAPRALAGDPETAGIIAAYRGHCSAAAPTPEQARLSEAVCQQARAMPGLRASVAEMCYEAHCAGASGPGSLPRPPFCGRLLPGADEGGAADGAVSMAISATLALVAAPLLLVLARVFVEGRRAGLAALVP